MRGSAQPFSVLKSDIVNSDACRVDGSGSAFQEKKQLRFSRVLLDVIQNPSLPVPGTCVIIILLHFWYKHSCSEAQAKFGIVQEAAIVSISRCMTLVAPLDKVPHLLEWSFG